ncbi:hypothetical protein VNO78_12800 [Psophocarpus tetragonolobus]|uniref:TF-B3 domain-containing protein n=1 Tax=Psophocarpus tetragonolobus TaxID=3891 RepID=A0AAN9SRJ3_PSOTE
MESSIKKWSFTTPKRKRSSPKQKMHNEGFTESELMAIEALVSMKLSQANKKCKHMLKYAEGFPPFLIPITTKNDDNYLLDSKKHTYLSHFEVGSSSSSSRPIMEIYHDESTKELFSLVTTHPNEYRSLVCNRYPSYLPPLESIKEYVLECVKPCKKKLQSSDLTIHANRLLLRKKDVEQNFLPMLKNEENIEMGVEACAYDMHGNNYKMEFKKWSNKYYVLTREGWKKFFITHQLQKGNEVTVWMFRHSISKKVCFLLEYQNGTTP